MSTVPPWLEPVSRLPGRVAAEELSHFVAPVGARRHSAVLMLFGEGPAGPDVLLIERAHDLRSHAGQPAFPGGMVDPGDDGPVGAALREAEEETGLDPAGVEVLGVLPGLWLPPSQVVVTPVLGWWLRPSPVSVVDPREVASVHRVPLADLLEPANRLRLRHPTGYVGAAFRVSGLLVWGFTAGLLDRVLRLAGLELPWDPGEVQELPPELQPARPAQQLSAAGVPDDLPRPGAP